MIDARTSSGDEWAEELPNAQPAWVSTDYVDPSDENALIEEEVIPQRTLSRRRSMECSAIELRIVDTEVNQDHTVYVIEVTCGIRHWIVKRRYKDFDYLDRKLRKFLPAVTMPSLPAKSYWRSSNNPSIVEQRKLQLQDYLRALLGMNQIWARNDLVLFLNDESNIMTFIWSVERMRRLKEMLRLTKVDNPNEADKINSDLEEARKQVDELQAKLSQMEMIFLQQATGAASQQLSSAVLRSLSRADNPLSLQLALEMSQEHASLYQEEYHNPNLQHANENDKHNEDDDLQVDIAGPEATGASFSDYSDNNNNHLPGYALPPMEPEELLKALSLAQRQESVADIMNNNNNNSPSKGNVSNAKTPVSTNDARTLTISYEIQEALRISEELLLSTNKHKINNNGTNVSSTGSHHSDSETSSRNGQLSQSLSGLAVTSSVDAVMKGLLHQEATAAISLLLDFDYNRNEEDSKDTSQLSCQWVGEVFALTDALLSSLQPSTLSLDLRQQIFKHIRDLLARTVGGQAFPYGSYISHTFLPDGDLDITSFVPNNYHSTTTTTNATTAASGDTTTTTATSTTTTTKVLSHDKENAWYVKVNEALCFAAVASQERQMVKAQPSITQTNGVYAFDELFVSNVSFVNTGEIKEIRCQVNNVRVDIATNQLTSIMMETLIERVNEFVGKNHLFKRALLLIKSWLKYDAFGVISTTEDNHASSQQESLWDKLPTSAIVVIVIYIFQYEGEHISSPLQVLLHFFLTMLNFDWGKFAMTIHGMVKTSEVEQHVSSYHYQSPTFHYHHHHHRHHYHHNNHHNKNNTENKANHIRFFPDSLFDFAIGDEIRSERPPALQRDKSKESNHNHDKKDTKEGHEEKEQEQFVSSEATAEVHVTDDTITDNNVNNNGSGDPVSMENDNEQSEIDSFPTANIEKNNNNNNAATNATNATSTSTSTNLPHTRTRHHHNHKEYKCGIFNVLDPFQSQHNLFSNLELQDIENMVSAVVNGYKHLQAILDACSKQNTPTNNTVKPTSQWMETFWHNSLLKSKLFDATKSEIEVVSENKAVEEDVTKYDVLQCAKQDLQFSRFYGSIALGGKIELATLTQMILIILDKRGPMPVGEIGKNLQAILGCENLSRRLKEQFTGLKRAIEHANTPRLKVGSEHQFNPVVTLVGDASVLPDHSSNTSDQALPETRWMFHHAGYMFTPYQIHLAMQAQVAKEAQLLLQRSNSNTNNLKNNSNKSNSPSVTTSSVTPPLSVSPVNHTSSQSSNANNTQAYHNNTNNTNSQMMRNRGNSGSSNFRSVHNSNSSTNSSLGGSQTSSNNTNHNQQQHCYSPNSRHGALYHQMRSPNRRNTNNNNTVNYNSSNTSPNYPTYYPHHPPPPTMSHHPHHGPLPPMQFFPPPTFLPVPMPVPVTFDPVTGAPLVAPPPPASPLASSYGSYTQHNSNSNSMMYQQHPTLQAAPNTFNNATTSNNNLSPTSSSPTPSCSEANNNTAVTNNTNSTSVPVPVPMPGYYMPPPPPPYAMYTPSHNNANNNNIAQSPPAQQPFHYYPPPPFPSNGLVPPIPIPGYYQPANGNAMMNNNTNVSYSYHHSLSNSLSSSYGTSNMHLNNAAYANNNTTNATNNSNNNIPANTNTNSNN